MYFITSKGVGKKPTMKSLSNYPSFSFGAPHLLLIFSPIEIESNLHKWVVTKEAVHENFFSRFAPKYFRRVLFKKLFVHAIHFIR